MSHIFSYEILPKTSHVFEINFFADSRFGGSAAQDS